MTVLRQPATMGDVLKYEVNPNFTRETITLLAGAVYPVGAVLGKITASGKYKLATSGGTDGAQTAAAVLLYAVDATDAGSPVASDRCRLRHWCAICASAPGCQKAASTSQACTELWKATRSQLSSRRATPSPF